MSVETTENSINLDQANRLVNQHLPHDDELFHLMESLMHITDPLALGDVQIEHYRQAASAAAVLIAIKKEDKEIDFDILKLVCGVPMMPYRLVFAKRIAATQQVDIGLDGLFNQ